MKIKSRIKILILLVLVLAEILISNGYIPSSGSIGTSKVDIETYIDGENQITHPSIITFKEKWNGYKYWMTYTPYPNAEGGEENPSIAVSNDLESWSTPKGLINPIAWNEETASAEYKDGHILYRDDLDRIEVWYLGTIGKLLGEKEDTLYLFRKFSYDGIKWSDYEIMRTMQHNSQSVLWKDGKYILYGVGFNQERTDIHTKGEFAAFESSDGYNWSRAKQCSIGGNDQVKMWHSGVTYNISKSIYELVYIDSQLNGQNIWYTKSDDGIHFDKPYSIVKNDRSWNRLYRPILIHENGINYCYYGVITDGNEWYISLSKGKDLNNLKGINGLNRATFVLGLFLLKIKTNLRIEMLVMVVPLAVFLLIKKKRNLFNEILLLFLINYPYAFFKYGTVRQVDTVGLIVIVSLLMAFFTCGMARCIIEFMPTKWKDEKVNENIDCGKS